MNQPKTWSAQKQEQHTLAWERCRKIMLAPGGPKEYCSRIKKVFFKYGIQPLGRERPVDAVHDAACGTGYTTLPLYNNVEGNVVYSDGSIAAVELFHTNAETHGFPMLACWRRWQSFSLYNREGSAHAVLVLGNSLPYAGSWQERVDFQSGWRMMQEVRRSLAGIYWLVAKHGAFLFDLYHEQEGTGRHFFGEVDGCRLYWEIGYDPGKKLRVWRLTEVFEGRKQNFELHSLLLSHNEWIRLLKEEVGFRCVEKLPDDLQLEPAHYATFIALKGG